MNIKGEVINSFAKFILGKNIFANIKNLVFTQEGLQLSGSEKKAAVIAGLAEVAEELGGWLLNLGIELAVAFLRSYQEKNK